MFYFLCFFFSSRRRHTRCGRDWSSDVCSSDLGILRPVAGVEGHPGPLQGGPHLPEGLDLPEPGPGALVLRGRPDPFELLEGLVPDDPVLVHAHVPLEVPNGAVASFAEDAVLPAGVEPQGAQAALEGP